jgi:catechol 2,3-dioxygenase-like lactoylglutathione lyase family enzyme
MHITAVAASLVAVTLGGLPRDGQTQAVDSGQAAGQVLGTGAVTGFVEDMDRSLAFYHDVLGMEVPPLPASGARPYNPSNAQLFAMFDIHGATERHQHARVPGTDVAFELMEVQNVPFRTIPLRLQDSGAMTLVFTVKDLDALLEQVRSANVEIVSRGGQAVTFGDSSRAVMIRDVDGRFIELREPASTSAGSAGAGGANITAMRLSIAVNDLDETLRVYRDVLGFTIEAPPAPGADAEAKLRALTNLATATFRRSLVQGPGDSLRIEFVEYGAVDRRPLTMRIQDRGAARLQLRAENLVPLVARMRAAGLKVVSDGGGPVPIPPNFMGALVADPNNFFLTPFAPCDGCAPGLVSERD